MENGLVLRSQPVDKVALLTFNRPDKMNALSTPLLQEFEAHLNDIYTDASIRVVILTGAGDKAFIAGADISEYAGQSAEQFFAYQQNSRRLFNELERFPKPVIAAVNGYALGGGFEIALCCDLLIASRNARLGLPEGLLGLSPGGGGTQRLMRAVGRYVAADVLLSARRLSAEYAHQIGLVAEVTEPEGLIEAAIAKANYMLRVAPRSIKEMKRLIREGLDASLDTALSFEQEVLFRLYSSPDGQEGIRAFVEKRDAQFEGA